MPSRLVYCELWNFLVGEPELFALSRLIGWGLIKMVQVVVIIFQKGIIPIKKKFLYPNKK